jgi:hypothetical protein
MENKQVTLGAFLYIEGASDITSHTIVTEAAKRHVLEDTICQWTSSILGNRQITVTLPEEILEGSGAKGCMQGGVLLSLLHSLLVDEIREGLNQNGCYMLGYAVDTAILISRKFLNTVSELLPEYSATVV